MDPVLDPTPAHQRRRTVSILFAGFLIVLACGVGMYGLLTGPDSRTNHSSSISTPPPGGSASLIRPPVIATAPVTVPKPGELPQTTDGQRYAHAVATALFGWDTASGLAPVDYAEPVIADGDPSGIETNALASDVRVYLPTAEAWAGLRQYQTRQRLTIAEVKVPQSWNAAAEQAAAGQLLPGTDAYTVNGTRHREGIWNGEPVSSRHEVAFTVFIACAPSFERCHLLRLSQLNSPLP